MTANQAEILTEEAEYDRFEEFVLVISELYKRIQRIKDREMRELGLKGPHVMSLFYLSRYKEGLTAAQLCRLIAVDKAAVSRVLAGLQAQGLIVYPNAGRRYRVCAVLTDAGRVISEKLRATIFGIVNQASAGIDEVSRQNLYTSLHHIAQNLKTLLPDVSGSGLPDFKSTGEEI